MRAKKEKQLVEGLGAEETATLLTHVRELQIRLLITAGVLVGAGVVAYLYYPQIIELLRKPLNAPLIISSVSGSFSFVMKICLVAGIAVSVPLIVYNFIMFVRPAFIEVFTRKRVFLMTLGSVAAAAGGTLFGYYFIIPGAIHFFSGFHVSGVNTLIQADGYLNFVINVLITFTLMFQLPIVVSLIDRIMPIPPRAMWKGEKWAFVGSIIIALVVPFAMDLMTQVLIAAPIFLLYNISFLVVVFQHRYARRVARRVAKLEARVEQKAARIAAKQAGAAKLATRRASAPVLAARVPAPHPQLAEVLALETAPAAQVRPPIVHKVIQKTAPVPITTPAAAHVPQPVAITVPVASMDGMSPRMRPAAVMNAVVRTPRPLAAPQRPSAPAYRSLRLMSDIR